VNRSHLSEIESGDRYVRVDTLERIATALNIKITALFAGYKNADK
jgi:transcriptional regulator with XRE-family HTH domain